MKKKTFLFVLISLLKLQWVIHSTVQTLGYPDHCYSIGCCYKMQEDSFVNYESPNTSTKAYAHGVRHKMSPGIPTLIIFTITAYVCVSVPHEMEHHEPDRLYRLGFPLGARLLPFCSSEQAVTANCRESWIFHFSNSALHLKEVTSVRTPLEMFCYKTTVFMFWFTFTLARHFSQTPACFLWKWGLK